MIESIGFIGSGNLASNLALAFAEKHIEVKFVYSKTKKNSNELAQQLNCQSLDSLKQISEVDAIFICVNDDSIEEIATTLSKTNSIIIHCSGSVSRKVLSKCEMHGVFYPFQSFTKSEKANWSRIPILIDANNFENQLALTDLAKKLSYKVEISNSEERKTLHLVGVLMNNFTNHLAVLSNQFLIDNHLNPELLRGLSEQTFERILSGKPEYYQTGPAVRNDKKTINAHLDMLKGNDNLKAVYQQLTESILSINVKLR